MNMDTRAALTYLVRTRRTLRLLKRTSDGLWEQQRLAGRRIRQLQESGSPFHTSRIARLEADREAIQRQRSAMGRAVEEIGRQLLGFAPMIDRVTTPEQRYELLNVNVADRPAPDEKCGLVAIIFAHGLEDSAERRHEEWNNGPLFSALHSVFMDFLTETPEGQAVGSSLFEPGGLFEWLPSYSQQPDGTYKRNPPPLRSVTPSQDSNLEG